MAIVLKVTCQGQMHRVPLSLGEKPNYAAVTYAIEAISPRPEAYVAKYADEEGDLCTLVEATFPDFLSAALESAPDKNGRAILKLEVFPAADAACGATGLQAKAETRQELVSTVRSLRLRGGGLGASRGNQFIQTRPRWEEDTRDLEDLLKEIGEDEPQRRVPHAVAKKQKRSRKDRLRTRAEPKSPKGAHSDEEHQQDERDEQTKETTFEEQVPPNLFWVEPQPECVQHGSQMEHHEEQEAQQLDEQDDGWKKAAMEEHPDASPRCRLQLWPSTPEATPPSSPRSLLPMLGDSTEFLATHQMQQVVWVPVLMRFAGGTIDHPGHVPAVPTVQWVS